MIIPIRGNVGVYPQQCDDETLQALYVHCELKLLVGGHEVLWGRCLEAINAEFARRAAAKADASR